MGAAYIDNREETVNSAPKMRKAKVPFNKLPFLISFRDPVRTKKVVLAPVTQKIHNNV